MVQTKNLTYAYQIGLQFTFPNIEVKSGEHLLIIGPSGVGKTTLLNLMTGLLLPKTGTIKVAGTPLNDLSRRKLDTFRGEYMGLIFQQYHFINSLSVYENLRLRQRYPRRKEDHQRRFHLAERLGLSDHLDKKVFNLSQGQKQRLSIALGLIHRPKVVFADEPTSNLDDKNCDKVVELLQEEARMCSSSLIIITHDYRVKSHFPNQVAL